MRDVTVCRDCNISLPPAMSGDQCEECADPATQFLQHPEPDRPKPVVVHNAAIERQASRVGFWKGSGEPIVSKETA